MTTRTWVIAAAIIASLAAGLVWWRLQPQAPSEAVSPAGDGQAQLATPVETVSVKTGPLTRRVQAVGSLRPNEGIILRPEIAGKVESIGFEEGEKVSAGHELVTLDDTIYRAELAETEARAELTRTSYQRARTLRRQNLNSAQDLDQALSEFQVSQAEVALARARLSKTVLGAPFDGVVGLRDVSVGDFVFVGQDIVDLLDLSSLKVDFRVPEIYLRSVQAGQTIEVNVDAFPDQTFQGRVYAIDPQIDVQGRSILIRAHIDNPDGALRSGLFVRVNLIVSSRDDAILIPEDALVPQGEDQFVFRVVDGKAAWTPVQIGQRQFKEVEITDGLAPGDTVVVAGQMKIRDGAPVQPMPREQG